MPTEAMSEANFLREFTKELHNKNAALFIGAGLSIPTGYVDWRGLLKEIIEDLQLDPSKEHDLVTVAQYSCNQAGGSRAHLTKAIFDHFSATKHPTQNHRIVARLPVYTIWTTNYDKLIEHALELEKKVPDVKYTVKQLSVTRPDRDVAVYKMHGDIDHPADAVICKDDYEAYPHKMAPFMTALRGDLVEKTFLFLGFSFTDPNIDYILSRVRVQYERDQRHHYCIQRKVSKDKDESDEEFQYRVLKQEYFIRDLKRFSVFTVLVDEYNDITRLLERLESNYKRSSVFISGAAEEYGSQSPAEAQAFIHDLSRQIAAGKNRVITGFGVGVGGAVINGVLAHLHEAGKTISDEDIVMRPFPQVATGGATLAAQWTAYREAMLEYAGVAIFLYGNKRDATGKIVVSNGMQEEFEICIRKGVRPIPVGATGYMAEMLWKTVASDVKAYFPNASTVFEAEFAKIGDAKTSFSDLITSVKKLLDHLKVLYGDIPIFYSTV